MWWVHLPFIDHNPHQTLWSYHWPSKWSTSFPDPMIAVLTFSCQCPHQYGLRTNLHTATKFQLCIPGKGIARPQSQFPHSCVCERFIYSQDWFTYFPTDTMWKLGLRPRSSFSGNIWFEFLVLCLYSVVACVHSLWSYSWPLVVNTPPYHVVSALKYSMLYPPWTPCLS